MNKRENKHSALLITILLMLCLLAAGVLFVLPAVAGRMIAQTSPEEQTNTEKAAENLRAWLGLDTVRAILAPEDSVHSAAGGTSPVQAVSTAADKTKPTQADSEEPDMTKQAQTESAAADKTDPTAAASAAKEKKKPATSGADSSGENTSANPEEPEKTEKTESSRKAEKTEKAESSQKAEKTEKAESSQKAEKTEKAESSQKAEKTEKADSKQTDSKTAEDEKTESKQADAKQAVSKKPAGKTAEEKESEEKESEEKTAKEKESEEKAAEEKATDSKKKEENEEKDPQDSMTKLQKQYVQDWEEYHGRAFPLNAPLHNYNWKYLQYDEMGRLHYEGDKHYTVRHGIDVSEFQGRIDWEKVRKSGIDFVFVRAGHRMFESGELVRDSRAVKNLARAKKAGLEVGVYVFSQAVTESEAREEARLCLDVIKESGVEITLPIVFDPEIQIEYYARINFIDGEQFTDNTLAFCKAIKKAGYTPAVYANCSTETDILDMSRLDGHALLWYADYNYIPESPYQFTFWQYSNTGRVEGIPETETDLNVWFVEKQ